MSLRLLIGFSAIFAASACKKKQAQTLVQVEPPPFVELTSPDKKIQVLSVSPDELETGVSTDGIVRGSGFEDGVEVLGGLELQS